jgi:hypothetical protein
LATPSIQYSKLQFFGLDDKISRRTGQILQVGDDANVSY